MTNVLILSPSFGKWSAGPAEVLADAGLTLCRPSRPGPLTSAQVRDELDGMAAVVVGLDEVDAEAISTATDLRVIAKHGVGVDNIDVAAAAARGIRVVNVPNANAEAVADLVLGLMLNLMRRIGDADASIRRGEWETFAGPELGELTVGIVGYGRIGRAVGRRAAAFGTRLVAFDPYAPADSFGETERAGSIAELLECSDLVTLHMPGGGPPIIGAEQLRLLEGGYLINAARGDVVDEAAVAGALAEGTLRGYAADAFTREPLRDSPLLGAPNTILTPHIGAFSHATNARMGTSVARDVVAVLRAETPAHEVLPPDA